MFMRWLDIRIGSFRSSGSLNRDILEAQQEAPVLRRLVEKEIPAAVLRCVKTHHFAADVAGAEFIREIAFEPECLALRQRVIDLQEAAVAKLQAYPLFLDDDFSLKNEMLIRKRMLPTCGDCPYLDYRLDKAPSLCPSALMAGIKPDEGEFLARPD